MRKFAILLPLLICTILLSLVGCSDNQGSNLDLFDNSQTDNNSSVSDNKNTDDALSLRLNIDGEIADNKIFISVPNNVSEYSFINAFSFSDKYRLELHWDKSGLSDLNIVSKTVNLDEGDNILYALFINKENSDNISLYEINVHRVFSANVTYKIVFSDGRVYKTAKNEQIETLSVLSLSYKPSYNDFSNGYTFGYYANTDLVAIDSVQVKDDIVVYIVQVEKEINVSLNKNGGDLSVSSVKVKFGAEYDLPQPRMDEYQFIGWVRDDTSELVDNSGKWNIPNDITLTAQWKSIYTIIEVQPKDAENNIIIDLFSIENAAVQNKYDYTLETLAVTYTADISYDVRNTDSISYVKNINIVLDPVLQVFLNYEDLSGNIKSGWFYVPTRMSYTISINNVSNQIHFTTGTLNSTDFDELIQQNHYGTKCTAVSDSFRFSLRIWGTLEYLENS